MIHRDLKPANVMLGDYGEVHVMDWGLARVEAERAADGEATAVKPWQPVSEKKALLAARRLVKSYAKETALAFAETTRLLDAALTQEAENASARSALAALWKGRLVEAEQRGDEADTAHALAMLERYDDGALAPFVKGDGAHERLGLARSARGLPSDHRLRCPCTTMREDEGLSTVSWERTMSSDPTLDQFLNARPTDEETARTAVRPYLTLNAAARLDALVVLLRGMDRLLGDRRPLTAPDDVVFWRHWRDPAVGCPR